MKKYKFKDTNGDITFSKINDNEIIVWQEWDEESYSSPIKLRITDLQRFGKIVFKVSRQLENTSNYQSPTYSSGLTPNTVIPQQKTLSTMKMAKRIYPKAYAPWSPEEESLMVRLFQQGMNFTDIAAYLNRNEGGIRSRLKKLGLIY